MSSFEHYKLDTNFKIELKRIYLEESGNKVLGLKQAMRSYLKDPKDPANLADFIEIAHKFAGAGTTYGFATISHLGSGLEILLRALRSGNVQLSDNIRNALARAVKAIQSVFDRARENQESTQEDFPIIAELLTLGQAEAQPTNRNQRDEARQKIIVADTDPDSLRATSLSLVKAGFEVLSFQTPAEVMAAIKTERPDLFILDVKLPAIDGHNLSRSIRKVPALAFTPMVYTTSRSDMDEKGSGLRYGTDHYILKPYEPEELIVQVASYLARIKFLRDLTIRDGLTQAYNHRYFQERIVTELGRARRYNRGLTIALVDIDHFKQVNDTYGHPVGDLILRRLVDLLKQTLRDVDIVCRYGGAEMGIIMPETTGPKGLEVMNRLREKVANQVMSLEGLPPDFHLTLSAGIASYPNDGQLKDELISKSTQALSAAKTKGRNFVCNTASIETE